MSCGIQNQEISSMKGLGKSFTNELLCVSQLGDLAAGNSQCSYRYSYKLYVELTTH